MQQHLDIASVLPSDHQRAMLVGRAWVEGQGAVLVQVREDGIYNLTPVAPTCSDLLQLADPAAAVRGANLGRALARTADVLANSAHDRRDGGTPWFMAPCDLQAVKAAGVTFVASMLERVIEEQARGDASKALALRQKIVAHIGDDLSRIQPGTDQAEQLKQTLIAAGVWSQYLEVGIGVDAEVFTKSQPMSAVGLGAEIGIHPRSNWNNPEPEVVLAVNAQGQVQGAALGNDVNLRDFEGRSALLLGKAKDNNASCAIGPFIRLFDDHFQMDHVRHFEVSVRVTGTGTVHGAHEPFGMQGVSSMSKISRDPLDLVKQTIGDNHQYPDGLMLFLGTMFTPTQDRLTTGEGFTHHVGDLVRVSVPQVGGLVNQVNHSDRISPWTYGAGALMRDLAKRGALA